MSNSLEPDQARHFAGPDLGPNCRQRLSADNKRMSLACDKKNKTPARFYTIVSMLQK